MPLSLFPSGYQLRQETLPLLPAGSEPISILHISDLHMVSSDRRQQQWLKSLSEIRPDFVIGTGDYLGGEHYEALFDSLENLFHFPGAYVLGSNDYYAPSFKSPHRYLLKDSRTSHKKRLDTAKLKTKFSQHWTNLTHRKVNVVINGTNVELRGTDDAHLELDTYVSVSGPKNGDVAIGVTHAPYRRIIDAMEGDGVDMIFAGHTHGGQWCLPGGRALVTNCDLAPEHARGVSRHGNALLEVCAGSGASPFAPLRLFCPPEAALLTLTSR